MPEGGKEEEGERAEGRERGQRGGREGRGEGEGAKGREGEVVTSASNGVQSLSRHTC